MPLSNFLRGPLPFLAVALSPFVPEDASAATPPEGLLFRADVGIGPGFFWTRVAGDGRDYDTAGLTLTPTLGLNLGYAPSPRLRLGIGGTAQGTVNLAYEHASPGRSIDSMMRWTVGPTVGFRGEDGFEFELGLAATGLMFVGGEVALSGHRFPLGTQQFGAVVSGTGIWRPYGPQSIFGLFASVNGGAAFGGDFYPVTTILATSLLGVSFGL